MLCEPRARWPATHLPAATVGGVCSGLELRSLTSDPRRRHLRGINDALDEGPVPPGACPPVGLCSCAPTPASLEVGTTLLPPAVQILYRLLPTLLFPYQVSCVITVVPLLVVQGGGGTRHLSSQADNKRLAPEAAAAEL